MLPLSTKDKPQIYSDLSKNPTSMQRNQSEKSRADRKIGNSQEIVASLLKGGLHSGVEYLTKFRSSKKRQLSVDIGTVSLFI